MTALVVLAGMTIASGLFLVARGAMTRTIALGDALTLLDPPPQLPGQPGQPSRGLEHAADQVRRGLRLPLTAKQQRLLALQGRSVGDFFAEKLVWATAGLLLPAAWAGIQLAFGNPPGLLPLGASLLCGLAGFFLADVRLKRGSRQEHRSATDAIHTFFDLVVLERLANASAVQATANAAAVSGTPLFRRISAAVERARLEQTQPWAELRRVAAEWDVPELTDFADVMQLEEQGAGLAEVLQARVKELRDAHLSRQKTEAQARSESMTLWMTLPALLLGVALLAPALLAIVAR